jgi:signal peptidase I
VAERQRGSLEPADDHGGPSGTAHASSPALREDGFPAVRSTDAPVDPGVAEPSAGGVDDARDRRGGSDDGRDRGILSFLRELPVLVLLAFALALLLKTFVVQAFYIPSGSMEPTLMPGDRVLVEKVLYHPSRGDIIVFQDPHPGAEPDRGLVGGFLHWLSEGLGFVQPVDEDFIKRVIGLPGDTVELRHGTLFVNGTRVPQPYLRGPRDVRDYGPKTVPPDSRFGLGFVPENKVVGRAFVVIWPPSRIGWLH